MSHGQLYRKEVQIVMYLHIDCIVPSGLKMVTIQWCTVVCTCTCMHDTCQEIIQISNSIITPEWNIISSFFLSKRMHFMVLHVHVHVYSIMNAFASELKIRYQITCVHSNY